MVSRDAFGGLMFAAFHAKKIFSGHSCYDQPIFNRVFTVFIQSKLLITLLHLQHALPFYRLLLFLDLLLIQGLKRSLNFPVNFTRLLTTAINSLKAINFTKNSMLKFDWVLKSLHLVTKLISNFTAKKHTCLFVNILRNYYFDKIYM